MDDHLRKESTISRSPETEPGETTHRTQDALCLVLLAVVLAFHASANYWWLVNDIHPLQNDDSLHMETARNYYAILSDTRESLPMRLYEVFNVQNYYPPLLHFLGAVAMAIWGYSPDLLAGTVTAYFLVLILGAHAVARTFLGRWEALLAAVVVSFTPILYGASRTFMTDYLSAAFVVWAMYCLIRSDCFKQTGWVFCFAVLNGLGIMTRQTTCVFYLVPCVVLVSMGFVQAFYVFAPEKRFHFDRKIFAALLLNCAMTLVVSLGIVLPWHLHHLEFLLEFYTGHFYRGEGVFSAGVRGLDLQIALGLLGLAVLLVAVGASGTLSARRALHRRGWDRHPWLWGTAGTVVLLLGLLLAGDHAAYGVFLLSDGVFVPLFVLGALGAFLSLSKGRRSLPSLMVLLWLLSSYVLLSLVFTSRVPRYIIPAVPALSVFAVVACTSIRPWPVRIPVVVALLALLGLQFGHLTWGAQPGVPAVIALPPPTHSENAPLLARTALPVLKDHIVAGNYAFRPVQREDGFDNRLFKAMVRDMRERRPVYEDWANYQRLTNYDNFEGLWFVEAHYRPEPNPFSVPGIEPGPRPLRAIGTRWQRQPEELLARLDQTDFILLWSTYRTADGTTLPEEQTRTHARNRDALWRRFFEERDFVVVDAFEAPAYNDAQDGFYTLMGRKVLEREVYRSWDLTSLAPEDAQWSVVGGAVPTEEGLLRKDNRNGPLLQLTDLPVESEQVAAFRVELEAYVERSAGRIAAAPEQMHFYWARTSDVQAGDWPFVSERGVALRKTGPNTWEANLRRHPRWVAVPDQFMVDATLPPPTFGSIEASKRWELTRLPKQAWEWTFEKGADLAPSVEGALRMTQVDGPHMQLEKTLRAENYRALLVRIDAFHRSHAGNRPVELAGMQAFWADPETVSGQEWPFDNGRSAAFKPAGEALPGYWVADLSASAGWRGAVQRIMVSVNVPEEMLHGTDDHFSLYTKDIALVGYEGGGGMCMVVKRIEFLR